MIRRRVIVAATIVVLFAIPGIASAHPVGGRLDLPVPLSFFIVGAVLVLVVSFALLLVMWPSPRWQESGPARPISSTWVRPLRIVLGVVGMLSLVLVIATGLWHGSERTIGPVIIFVHFWVVVPFVAAVIGNWWLALSPWRIIGSWVAPTTTDDEPAASFGIWPAAALLFAFTWLELVFVNNGDPRILAYLTVAYTIILLAAVSWFGVRSGLHQWGFMENYARLVGAISPIEWQTEPNGELTLVRRSWLRALPSLPQDRGLAAFVVVMLGTVTYDGISSTDWWVARFRDDLNNQLFGTAALLIIVAAIGMAYLAASWAAARLGESELTAGEVAQSFAHTLVPIALAYAVAHYVTLMLFEGQLLVHLASDPFGFGWDLFGTADWKVEFWSWLTPTLVWYVQVAAIVLGHVAGVVLAHDRALAVFSGERAARSQAAMIAVMIGLTWLGLFILSG